MIHPHHFLIMGLAVWRLANMLVDEAGPGDIFGRLRKLIIRPQDIDRDGSLAQLFTCIYCMTMWLSLIVFLGYALWPFYTLYCCIPFALAGFCAVLQQLTYDRTLSVEDRRRYDSPPDSLDD